MSNLLYVNPILNLDSYKLTQRYQYPAGMTNLSSYIEARAGGDLPHVVFFGLQAFIRQYLMQAITSADVVEASRIAAQHGIPFYADGWQAIVDKHAGFLPLRIQALAEGAVTKPGVALVQVQATDPEFAWLVSPIETALLRAIWYPTTVASYSFATKLLLKKWLTHTADDLSALDFMLHDFGARGVSSFESSVLGGAAHLLNFKGTDTISALPFIQAAYDTTEVVGFSVPASEHSTITSWGKSDEVYAYDNMLNLFGDGNIVSIVSDSYDIYNAIDVLYGEVLKDKIENMKARLVVRPDSGVPEVVVCEVVERLGAKFGYTVNSKGYKVLNPKVRVLQGDGVNLQSIDTILTALSSAGWSAENVLFGMGGALLQIQNRDTLRFAMKASAIEIDGVWQDVYKEPKTDPTKNSKRGVLSVVYANDVGELVTIRKSELEAHPMAYDATDYLRDVWKNGEQLQSFTFADIRERIDNTYKPG
jgi:nicotinamide phosphoribosyltransferase